jgi:hypothetical protein
VTHPSVNCPNCGAPNPLVNPGVLMVACAYCRTAIYWDREKISAAGFRAVLPEGYSRLYLGATGSLGDRRLVVLGRARYSFARGFWDEWYLEMQDGSLRWLTEDNRELRLEQPVSGMVVPPAGQCAVGLRLPAGGVTFVLTEIGVASCVGIEGSLPKVLRPGEAYGYADGASPDGVHSLGIEYNANPPAIFCGDWLDPASLKLDDEGDDW